MLFNYLKTALRSFKQHKQHFILNVLGLSVGISAAILVALFAVNELSYDSQHPNASNVYRVTQDYSNMGLSVMPRFNYNKSKQALTYTQVEDFFLLTLGALINKAETNVTIDNKGYQLDSLYGATRNIHDFIHLPVLAGNLTKGLSKPNHIALSRTEAIRLFGKINIIGKTLAHKNGNYTVAAVFEDLPENTHFTFKALIYVDYDKTTTTSNDSYVYLRLAAGVDISALEKILTDLYFVDDFKGKVTIELYPLLDIHLTAKSSFEMKTGGTKQVVVICVVLSILLIAIASFNFINMTIAQSTKRAKEVGVRKALGASKGQLVSQFLGESLIVALFSLLIASMLVELSLPSFNILVDRQLVFDYGSSFSGFTLLIMVSVGFLAGLYPALFISSFSAKRVLSGDLQHGVTAIWVRKTLLLMQATFSVALIIATIILQQQLAFLQSMPLGYETKNRVIISGLPRNEALTKESDALMTKISNISGVQHATALDTELTVSVNSTIKPVWPNGESSGQLTPIIGVGYNIVKILELNLLAGRDFSPKFSSDWFFRENNITNVAAIITESVVKESGYNDYESVLGKVLTFRSLRIRVVGVVSDVKVGNSQSANMNVIFLCGLSFNPKVDVLLAIEQRDYLRIKQEVRKIIADSLSIYDPTINLLSDNYEASLVSDKRIAKVVSIFSGLAIFLTCLGTFGLASFATLRRQKEVAMRKVLGASRLSIVNLLAKEFLVLVTISIVIAFPLTYWLIDDWLENFNDRIDQAFWVYVIAAIAVAAITWLTVASLAFKAASTRPSLILRDE